MGAAQSSELRANTSGGELSIGKQARKHLRYMMDPNSALIDLKPDANLDIIYANPDAPTPEPATQKPGSSTNTPSSSCQTLDADNAQDDADIDHADVATDSTANNSQVQKEPEETLDVYMSLVAPAPLVRMLSSSSSSSTKLSNSATATHKTSPEEAV